MGYGFGTFLFGMVSVWAVNPDNIRPTDRVQEGMTTKVYFTEEVYSRYPYMLECLSIAYFIVGMTGALLLEHKTTHHSEESDDSEESVLAEHPSYGTIPPSEYTSVSECLKSKPFSYLAISASLSTSFGLFVTIIFKPYGLLYIQDDHFMTFIGGCASIANGLGRLFWGTLMDYHTFYDIYTCLIGITIFCCLVFQTMVQYAWPYLFLICTVLFVESGQFTVFPIVLSQIFGEKLGYHVIAYFSWTYNVGNLIATLMTKFIAPLVSYPTTFQLYVIITFIPLIFAGQVMIKRSIHSQV
eukprot:TRINITY_DN14107_c0_g1_i2.p1 TRINITY_DN14107_c0_g1~~TRINITY_DN14107_c0_g1_i2.p1  ORF type:complete len:298 (+),score=10.39 TRINITY_DN14107_c0_g1_i2:86-979(+)